MNRSTSFLLAALPLMLLAPAAAAQDFQDRDVQPPAAGDVPPPATAQEVTFSAARLDYDDTSDIVTASGDVRMQRDGNRLRADQVSWNRVSGEVRAKGNVAVISPDGDTAYGDDVVLTDSLRDGIVDNLLLVLADGGRIAAARGERRDGTSTLDHAAYTPCAVVDDDGCPKEPIWQITAVRVVHNPQRHRIYYQDARLRLFGVPILWMPVLSHPDGSGGGGPGLLVPSIRYDGNNGLELELPYYWKIAPNRDLTVTPHIYSDVLPAIEVQYRALTGAGAYQIRGMATYGSRLPVSASGTELADAESRRSIRGHIEANGRFQLDPQWSITGALRATTDRTFLRRYDISNDDRLRNTINAERITDNSYLSIAGWAVQTLRTSDSQGQQPIALPAIDYRHRLNDPFVGGRIELQANTLALLRTEGQDTQRAFFGARWDLRRYTPLGQEITLTAYARGDIYHTNDTLSTATEIYRGTEGWRGRGIGAVAADLRWPFVGAFLGGSQMITPRVQLVASPSTSNFVVPNEDARSIELEDSNLFALNRFPGYDRWEDGTRVTYGLEWTFDLPRVAVRSVVGQSYRLTDKPLLFPEGTGLSQRLSDVVGRTTIRYADFVSLIHRFRLDKDSLAIRRNEIDATIGTRRTYASIGYLRLNRDVDVSIEDLRDREEVRVGGRLAFDERWSVFGSTVIDLTGRSEDPLSVADGYDPVRHRVGVAYEDECFEFGLTWRRDYDERGDARSGDTYMFRLAFKNLGR